MPLSTTVRRHVTQPRKIVFLSVIIGFIFFLFFISITLIVVWHHRSEGHNRLAGYTQDYVVSMFDELKQTLLPLRAATQVPCEQVRSDLTQKAAFASDIRAILLVRKDSAFCSSATGAMALDIHKISADTDTENEIDIQLISGTPMLRKKPAIVLWLKDATQPDSGIFTTLNINLTPYLLLASRQQEITGIAIAAGNMALSTWDNRVVKTSSLPQFPLRTIAIPGYPMTLFLYGEALPQRDIHMILLAGFLLGVLASCSSFLLLSLRLRPGKEILQGIKRGEFHVEYQPIVETCGGKTYGLEALMRWTHPTEGRIPPDAFISYAEAQNLIIPLTRHLFTLIASDAQRLQHIVPAGTQLGINLSPIHLMAPGFRQDVLNWLVKMPKDHFEYVFEITESTMVSDSNADELFAWIRDQQIKISIDDFGTGHSALIYLEKFHFDYLKIDRGFVQSIGMETVNSPVLDAVLALASKLNLNTVAEGVETEEQASWLVSRGVTHLQGYLFSRPRSVAQLVDYFATLKTPSFLLSRPPACCEIS